MLTALASYALVVSATAKAPFAFDAAFVEGCSCKEVCVTEITGKDAGCHGLGGISFKNATYGGRDFSGTRTAFVWDSGKWVRIYIDAPSAAKREAVTAYMKAVLTDWAPEVTIENAKVAVTSSGGQGTVTINGGQVGKITVKPVMGGDGKTPVVHDNLSSPMHTTLFQGQTTSATFAGPNGFSLDATNGFLNLRYRMKGKI